jgi:hypothetical protein
MKCLCMSESVCTGCRTQRGDREGELSWCLVVCCVALWVHSDVSLHVGAQLHLAEAAEARRARRLARDPAAVCTIWAGYPETRLQVRVSR